MQPLWGLDRFFDFSQAVSDTQRIHVLVLLPNFRHQLPKRAAQQPTVNREEQANKRQRFESQRANPLRSELNLDKWKAGKAIKLQKMQALASTDLPKEYYVRQTDLFFWWNITNIIYNSKKGHPQFVIVGSPGVGKSAFLTVLAISYARKYSRSVFLMRKQEHQAMTIM